MIDTITIDDPGFPWYGWWWTAGAIVGLLLIALALWGISRMPATRKVADGILTTAGILTVIAVIAIPLGAAVNGIVSTVLRSDRIHFLKVEAMEEKGYLNPSFTGDATEIFTAVKDGEYVLGTINEDPALTWRIVLIDKSSGSE